MAEGPQAVKTLQLSQGIIAPMFRASISAIARCVEFTLIRVSGTGRYIAAGILLLQVGGDNIVDFTYGDNLRVPG